MDDDSRNVNFRLSFSSKGSGLRNSGAISSQRSNVDNNGHEHPQIYKQPFSQISVRLRNRLISMNSCNNELQGFLAPILTKLSKQNFAKQSFVDLIHSCQLLFVEIQSGSKMTAPSEWVKFFEDANIPKADATKYGVSFAENRISMNMLGDLNKVNKIPFFLNLNSSFKCAFTSRY